MVKTSLLVAVALVAVAIATAVRARRRALPTLDDDCAVSECGADGAPLSHYAG